MTMQTQPTYTGRAGYLRDICQQLWPDPARAELGQRPPAGDPGDVSMIVLPGLRHPRLLVPAERRAAAAAVRRYGEPGSVRSALATRALSAALSSGLGSVMLRGRLTVRVPPGAQTIESRLSEMLGRPVLVGVHLGAPRANRKPVLQLLTAAGETIGFAKVAINPLTASLVRAEHAALSRLRAARLRQLQAPRVLGFDRWNGLEILVLSPLPVWQRRTPLRPAALQRAMSEIIGVAGVRESTLTTSEYWQHLKARHEGAGDGTEHATLGSALAELASLAGGATLAFGSWHGDWTPWNMASTADGLLVWDWERFTTPAPTGLDALHCWLQAEVVRNRRKPAEAALACVRRAPALLEPFGVTGQRAHLTALLYLADLSVRYLADQQEQAGAALGAPRRWLLPALTTGMGELQGSG
ncbi:MAG: hypothetical protein ACTHJW_14415 [Streptosporangiaceae bacterium]